MYPREALHGLCTRSRLCLRIGDQHDSLRHEVTLARASLDREAKLMRRDIHDPAKPGVYASYICLTHRVARLRRRKCPHHHVWGHLTSTWSCSTDTRVVQHLEVQSRNTTAVPVERGRWRILHTPALRHPNKPRSRAGTPTDTRSNPRGETDLRSCTSPTCSRDPRRSLLHDI